MTKGLDASSFAESISRKYGAKTAALASEPEPFSVIPTGSLSLDYALGTGGWPSRHPIEIFGPPDLGKSVLGLHAIANAQKQGKACVLIAVEPGFDPQWASLHGVDTDKLVIARPDYGEQAFSILFDCIVNGADLVVFDSLGAVMWQKELEPGEHKSRAGGQAKLITDGVKRAAMACWKADCAVIFVNQVRDVMEARMPILDSPGGHALKHACTIRVQLKPGERYTRKLDGYDVMIGRQVIASITRNKLAEGTNKRAIFDLYSMHYPDVPFGIDWATDILNLGKRTGVIKTKGAWIEHESFGSKYAKDVTTMLYDDSELVNKLRQEVLAVMNQKVTLNGAGPEDH